MAIDYYTKPARLLCRTFCIFSFLIWFSLSAEATTVLPVSLDKMTSTATKIFHGVVIAEQSRIDEVSKLIATFTTFRVIENIKGDAGSEITVKQIGGKLPDSKLVHRIHGIPRFTIGEEYIIFLPKPSRIGFSTPVGLNQGRFTISHHNGEAIVTNGRSIQSLLNNTGTRINAARVPSVTGAATNGIHLGAISGKPSYASKTSFITAIKQMASKP